MEIPKYLNLDGNEIDGNVEINGNADRDKPILPEVKILLQFQFVALLSGKGEFFRKGHCAKDEADLRATWLASYSFHYSHPLDIFVWIL